MEVIVKSVQSGRASTWSLVDGMTGPDPSRLEKRVPASEHFATASDGSTRRVRIF